MLSLFAYKLIFYYKECSYVRLYSTIWFHLLWPFYFNTRMFILRYFQFFASLDSLT